MEKDLNTVGAEEVAPQTPDEPNTTEADALNTEQGTTPERNIEEQAEQLNDGELTEQTQTAEGGEESAPFLMVRYNHQDRGLSQAEAQSFAQKGIQAESVMSDLRYLAANEGVKSVNEFIAHLKEMAENNRLADIKGQLVDDGNEELISSILKAQTDKIREAAGVIEQDERKALSDEYESEHTKLADEFITLQKEFPELKEFKDVPKAVLMLAQQEKISLLDAQLRFQHAENKKIKQAEQSAAAAAESSSGSVQSKDNDASSPLLDAMRKGVWS